MSARDYQLAAINSFFDHYYKGHTGNPVIVAPTGVGKSHIISGICERALKQWPHIKILVVTDVKELVQQNYNKLVEAWPTGPIGIYSAGLKKRDRFKAVTYCSIQSIQRKPDLFGHVDIVLIDECHAISPEEETGYQKFFAGILAINPRAAFCGLTATPWRMGFGPIWGQPGAFFSRKSIDLGTMECFNWFIDQGYLVPVIPRRTRTELDVTGVHLTGGEYNLKELQQKILDKKEATDAALQQCVDECGEMDSWLLFCAGVDHAIYVADTLTAMGVECRAVHTKMTDAERDEVLADFKAGRIQAVANNNILTKGFDHPGLKLIVMLRPTLSSILWVQMIGRGTRPHYSDGFDLTTQEGRIEAIRQSDKPYCMVYDFSANSRKLGPINDPVVPRRKGEKAGDAPVKECPKCQTYNHAKAINCIFCGYEFTFENKLKKDADTTDMIKKAKNDMPVIEEYRVDRISVVKKEASGKPAQLRVVYYCGYKMYNEWVCFEHEPGSFPRKKAETWWRMRSELPIPSTVDEASFLMDKLKVPTHIRVHTNLKYPVILAVDFKGTAFGKQDAEECNVELIVEGNNLTPNQPAYDEDDIPF